MKKLPSIPYCNDLSLLSSAIENLIELVQDYLEAGLDLDLDSIFEAGESGLTLGRYNEIIDAINAEISLQTPKSYSIH